MHVRSDIFALTRFLSFDLIGRLFWTETAADGGLPPLLTIATWFFLLRDHGGENVGRVSHSRLLCLFHVGGHYIVVRLDGPLTITGFKVLRAEFGHSATAWYWCVVRSPM